MDHWCTPGRQVTSQKYTYEKLVSQNQAPYFEPNAQSRIIRLTPEILEIEFDAALDDDYVLL